MATRASFSAPARAVGSLLLGALLLAACDFETTNPGRVLEDDLNAERAVKPLVTGMSSDFSAGYDWIAFTVALASDEMAGGGSYSSTAEFRVGLIPKDYVDWEWESLSRARWVAENGLERMLNKIPDYQFDGNELTARAYLLLGLSNRVLGESFCHYVHDGGPAQEPSVAFQNAVDAFTEAGLKCFGPSAGAAQLEGSKAFTKDFLARHDIPTAGYGNFTEIEPALAYIREQGAPIVVKASGLAAGSLKQLGEPPPHAYTRLVASAGDAKALVMGFAPAAARLRLSAGEGGVSVRTRTGTWHYDLGRRRGSILIARP